MLPPGIRTIPIAEKMSVLVRGVTALYQDLCLLPLAVHIK